MIATESQGNPLPVGQHFWKKLLLLLLLASLTVGAGWYMSKAVQKNENYVTLEAKTQYQTTGKDPCDYLNEILALATATQDSQYAKDIQQAQKFLGCRNAQKQR